MRDIFCDHVFIHFGEFQYSKSPMKKLFNDGFVIYSRLLNLPKHWHEDHSDKRNDLTKRIENKRMLFDNSDVYFFYFVIRRLKKLVENKIQISADLIHYILFE